MTTVTPTTIGDELPNYLRSMATPAVLKLTVEQAYIINQEAGQWPKGFTQKDADALDKLYAQYLAVHPTPATNAPFWNKTPEANQAFWAKKSS